MSCSMTKKTSDAIVKQIMTKVKQKTKAFAYIFYVKLIVLNINHKFAIHENRDRY